MDLYETKKDKPTKSYSAEYKHIYAIRESIKELKGKEINIRLSDKVKEKILANIKEKRYLSKATPKVLEKYLNKIYNFKDKNIISSIKKYN